MTLSDKRFNRFGPRALLCGFFLGAVLLFLSGGHGGAGALSAPAQQEVTVTVKLIQAYVTAKDGKPVTDLTADDFEISDGRNPVTITHFESHVVGGDQIAPSDAAGGPALGRRFFLFFDFAFVDAQSSRKAREAALQFVDEEIKPGDEVGILSYSALRGFTIHEYLTTDHAKIRQIVEGLGLRGISGRAESLTNFIYADELLHAREDESPDPSVLGSGPPTDEFFANMALLQGGGMVDEGRRQGYIDQARQFAQVFANLAQALRYLPGWKNIILFSSGISRALIYGERNITVPIIDGSNPEATAAALSRYDNAQSNSGVRTEFSAALKELKTANSPIYAIDCSRPQGEMDINNPFATSTGSQALAGKESLVQLANETGGRYFANSMDFHNALATIEDMTSAFYVLGWEIPANWDGEFHKIKVKVKRKGCKLYAQNGYYNPKPFREYSKFERLLQVTDLALSDNPQMQLPVEAPMGATPVMVGGWRQIAAYVGLSKEQATEIIGNGATAFLLIFDEDGGKTNIKNFRLKLPEGSDKTCFPAFVVPINPGRYKCRIVIQNTETGRGARGSASLVIPEAVGSSIWLDPPLLLELRPDGMDLGAGPGSMLRDVFGYDAASYSPLLEPLPAGPHKIYAALRCTLGSQAIDLEITAALEKPGGTGRSDVPVAILNETQEGALRTYLLELSTGNLMSGQHTVTIVAKEKSGGAGSYSAATFTVR